MTLRFSLDNRGRTWMCRSCKTIFFIPDSVLQEQKKVGCLKCWKQLWKNVPYFFLFIKDSEISRLNSHDLEQNTPEVTQDTPLIKNITFTSFNNPEGVYPSPSVPVQQKLLEVGEE